MGSTKSFVGPPVRFVRQCRIPALSCAFAVLVCELISRPYASMGICDDGPYIAMVQKLAATGHVTYNGWATAMLGWQLYLGAAFLKLFSSPFISVFTAVRMSTLLVAMLTAFLLQRVLVRANITERNATIGTLAIVLSPLYLILSVTFMTDIQGMFAVVLCLYGCLRALQATTSQSTITWLCVAVATNVICGSSRQIAWLGVLVMVPSTLWLLKRNRAVLLGGATALLLGVLCIAACVHWFLQQPYTIHEPLFVSSYPLGVIFGDYFRTFLDAVFLLLPFTVLFIPAVRRSNFKSVAVTALFLLICMLMAVHSGHIRFDSLLEPTLEGQWVNAHGIFDATTLHGVAPVFLNTAERAVLTIASLAAVIGMITALLAPPPIAAAKRAPETVKWQQLCVLLVPYTIFYLLLLIPRATTAPGILDRYLLGFLFIPMLMLVRYSQENLHPRLPILTIALVGLMAIFGITITHNSFALYRARVTLAAELRTNGIPDTAVDNGWEYNMEVELQHSAYLNDPRITNPAHTYIAIPNNDQCPGFGRDRTPHVDPTYAIAFQQNACFGPAPFAPVSYSRWLSPNQGTLYVVWYKPPSLRASSRSFKNF